MLNARHSHKVGGAVLQPGPSGQAFFCLREALLQRATSAELLLESHPSGKLTLCGRPSSTEGRPLRKINWSPKGAR